MRCITRIHLSDCGWHEAYYPGTTIELADPRTGKPAHTVFSLENTGGKTSFLSLVLSCFDTSERRFLKTLIRPNQKFGDYFGDVPAFILVEWNLSGGQASLLDPERLVTGQVVVPRGEGRQREFDRRFFTFRTTPDLSFDDIPAPGLGGFEKHGRLNGHQDVQRWLHAMRSGHPGNFQDFGKQSDWKRKLAEEKIDTELLAAQVEFNRSEGGIEDFLNFRSESQFLRKFLTMTVPEAEATAVRGVLAEHVVKLSDLPRLQRRQDAMRRLKDKFAPFVDIAGTAQAAQGEVSRLSDHASSLKAALVERGDQASRQAEELAGIAVEHETAGKEAEAACKTACVELASAAVETAYRRHQDAEALAATRDGERGRALERRHLLQAALSMRDILDDRSRSTTLQEAIDAENADLQPRRDALRGIGADLVATLGQRAAALRERQRSLSAKAEELAAAARDADAERTAAYESAQAERREVAQIDVNLGHARDFRAALEAQSVIEPAENAEAAAQRHAEAAMNADEEAAALRLRAEKADSDAAQHRDRQGDLKAERSGLEGEAEPLRATIREGETKRRDLAFDSTILELSGESEVDPDADAVARLLADARSKCAARVREDERRHEVLQADRESLEATGLASIDTDVRAVADRLRESGIADAQPYAVYLSDILRLPGEVRRFAELDPARFAGVAVPNRNALDTARRALESAPTLSRPVTVAIASDSLSESETDRFALTVDEPAAYDRVAARDLRRRIETDMAHIASSIETHQTRIERLEATMRELEAWRNASVLAASTESGRRWARKEARIAEIGGGDRSSVGSHRRRRAQTPGTAVTGLASATGRSMPVPSGRAAPANITHSGRLGSDEWRSAHLGHRQRTASAERLAQEKEAERDSRAREARGREHEASEASNLAAATEREASEIAYTGPGGRSTGNLDALRRDYERNLEALNALEQERVDHLRGQRDEIERALAEKEDRFEKAFNDLGRAGVEAEATRDGLREAAAEADAAVEAAQEHAAVARAGADAAAKEHRSEKEKRAEEVRPEPLMDLRTLEPEALSRVTLQAEAAIVEQGLSPPERPPPRGGRATILPGAN